MGAREQAGLVARGGTECSRSVDPSPLPSLAHCHRPPAGWVSWGRSVNACLGWSVPPSHRLPPELLRAAGRSAREQTRRNGRAPCVLGCGPPSGLPL